MFHNVFLLNPTCFHASAGFGGRGWKNVTQGTASSVLSAEHPSGEEEES